MLGLHLGWAAEAWAGPPELFTTVIESGGDASLLVAYEHGGGGLFVSRDAGENFGLLCSSVMEAGLGDGDIWAWRERPDGRTYAGLFSGMLASDPTQCGWTRVPGFEGRWVSDLTGDPDDPAVTYAVTSSGGGTNGLFRNDGRSDVWTLLGEEKALFLTRIRAVRTETGVRFYQSAVIPAQSASEEARHFIRVSDDRGLSWSEHALEVESGNVRLMAVDPTDPDRIVVGVLRPASAAPDDVLFSPMRGEPGTFQRIGQVTELTGVAFTPEGALLYADGEAATPGLFRVDRLGDAPRALSSELALGCLRYVDAHDRLYACRDWLFGTVDPDAGTFTMLADMREARHFVHCPDEASTARACEAQFRVNYCGVGHYPRAPLCTAHYGEDAMAHGGDGAAGSGEAGASGPPRAAGAGAAGGTNGGTPARAMAGAAGIAMRAPSSAPEPGAGCSAVGPAPHARGAGSLSLACALAALAAIGCRRRRERGTWRTRCLPPGARPGMTKAMTRPSHVLLTALGLASWFAIPSGVQAGPVEEFASIEFAASKPGRMILRWIHGDGGMYVSDDGGASFKMTCYGAASPMLEGRSVQAFQTAPDGSVCVGSVKSLHCSDASVCGWREAAELEGQFIADFAVDPLDPGVLYAATGTYGKTNGLWVRESPEAAWQPFGMHLEAWFSRVHVVKYGDGKRFYVSSQENLMTEGVDGGPPMTELRYYIRYSDDGAATWTSHYYGEIADRGSLRLVGVDPTNPDRIVVAQIRSNDLAPDDLLFSDQRGEPGTFTMIGQVTEFTGVAFTPDGALYYGDHDQMSPALYKVASLGEAPVKLNETYKIGCVSYDPASDELYVCADWRFGTVDRATGEVSMLFDMRDSSELLSCEGEPDMKEQCAVAFNPPNFCDPTHWPSSPVCTTYFGTQGAAGSGGAPGAGSPAAGASGMSGAAGAAGSNPAGRGAVAGGPAVAGKGGGAGGGAAPSSESSSGGGCALPGTPSARGEAWAYLGLGLAFAAWRARRQRS